MTPHVAFKEFPHTIIGDAEFFAEMFGNRVRYDVRQKRWLVADEKTGMWQEFPDEYIRRFAVEMYRRRQEPSLHTTPSQRTHETQWALVGKTPTASTT